MRVFQRRFASSAQARLRQKEQVSPGALRNAEDAAAALFGEEHAVRQVQQPSFPLGKGRDAVVTAAHRISSFQRKRAVYCNRTYVPQSKLHVVLSIV